MRFWYDFEFIERGVLHHPLEIISVGVVAEDGRTYYAQSSEFAPSHASEWVRENVLAQLTLCPTVDRALDNHHDPYHRMLASLRGHNSLFSHINGRCDLVNCPWRSAAQIRAELRAFFGQGWHGGPRQELWGYYAAYDHVLLASLFGTMMDLPPFMPMWTHDIMQFQQQMGGVQLPAQPEGEHNALADARWNRQAWEFLAELYEEEHAQRNG